MVSLTRTLSSVALAMLLSMATLLPYRLAAQENATLVAQTREAISRGLAYLHHPSRILDPDAVLLYAYLKDRFDLVEISGSQSIIAQIQADSTSQLYMFLRLAEPRACEMEFLDPNGPDDISLAGIWYDELEDTALLTDRIKATTWNWDEPYVITHALWAVAMAKHCFQARLDTALERQLVDQNKQIMLRNRPLWNDVAIEALAMAQYHDPTYVPPAEYIQELIELQNVYGSWNWEPRNIKTASQHTTVLALWALLQYKPLAWPTKPRDMVVR